MAVAAMALAAMAMTKVLINPKKEPGGCRGSDAQKKVELDASSGR